MAIDANILLQGRSPDVGNALLKGFQGAETLQMMNIRQQQAQQTQLANQQKLQEQEILAEILRDATTASRLMPAIANRDAQTFKQGIAAAGLPAEDVDLYSAYADAGRWDQLGQFANQTIQLARDTGIFQPEAGYQDSRTAIMKEAEASGFIPGTAEYKQYIQSRTARIEKPDKVEVTPGIDPATGELGYFRIDGQGNNLGKVEGVNPPPKSSMTIGPDGTVTFGPPTSSSNVTDMQKKVTSAIDSVAKLQSIEKAFDPKFLTYTGKGKQKLLSVAEKAGVDLSREQQNALAKHREFIEGVEQFFNAYKKEITGAAAAVSEIQQLKESIINPDLSPTEFKASFDRLKREAVRTINIQNELLAKGISPTSKNFELQADNLFLSGRGKTFQERGQELEQQGLSDEEIVQQLKLEGFSVK